MIYNLGSINADHVYQVPHMPAPGETLSALEFATGLGGKGTNQSVGAARAGAQVHHIGAVGPDGGWARDRLAELGVGVDHVAQIETPTGHAIINVDQDGENSIVLFPGANLALEQSVIADALAGAGPGDLLLLQNETAHQVFAAKLARSRGMAVMYSAAPFDVDAVRAVLPFVTILAMNEIESQQLVAALAMELAAIDVPEILVTLGAKGAELHANGQIEFMPSFVAEPVDTTGAGDTFAGYFAAMRQAGKTVPEAMRVASAAGALMVARHGAADVIPTIAEVQTYLNAQ